MAAHAHIAVFQGVLQGLHRAQGGGPDVAQGQGRTHARVAVRVRQRRDQGRDRFVAQRGQGQGCLRPHVGVRVAQQGDQRIQRGFRLRSHLGQRHACLARI